jgi:hypothetical protein
MKRQDFYISSYIAIFGSLWGASEITLGNLLHLFDVPFKGTVMSAIGCIICLVGSYLLPSKAKLPILSMGIIAMLIRLFSFGVFKIHIFVSMLVMSLLMQIVVSLLGYNLMSFIISGILVCFAPYASALVFFGLMMGQGALALYHGMIKDSATLGAIVYDGWIVITFTLITINIIIGSLAGVTAYYLGNKLKHGIRT